MCRKWDVNNPEDTTVPLIKPKPSALELWNVDHVEVELKRIAPGEYEKQYVTVATMSNGRRISFPGKLNYYDARNLALRFIENSINATGRKQMDHDTVVVNVTPDPTPASQLIELIDPCEYCGAAEAVAEIELSADRCYRVCARCAGRVKGM